VPISFPLGRAFAPLVPGKKPMNASNNTPLPCPTCHSKNTAKTVESLLTEIHICRDCHSTFVIEKPQRKEPTRRGRP
jgi:hypothetical protein